MRYFCASLLLAVIIAPAGAQTVDVRRDGAGVHAVDVHLYDGSLRIEGSETGEFRAEGTLNGDSGFLDVERTRAGFVVRVRRDERPGTPSAEISLQVPVGTRLHVEAGDADVSISGVDSAVTIRSRRGNIDLEYESSNHVDISTVSGDVRLEGRSFSDVSVRTVDGEIRATAERARDVSFRTTVGDMELNIDRFRRGDIELRTASGTIALTLGENSGAWIEMPYRGSEIEPQPEQASGAGFAAVEDGRGLAYRVGGGTGSVFIGNTGGRNVLAVD